ncbi:MAG: adenosylmethionine--8-amino-7-oxononanoate transaminase, partial [Rikenellaceae bacterium]
GITHEPAINLAHKLVDMLPSGLNRVFYSDSGSVAVEVALKMAIQYQYSKGKFSKNKIATIRGGYHGDTWHAMSVCDPEGGMHSLYNGRLTPQYFADMPLCGFYDMWNPDDFRSMKAILEKEHQNIAAVILEPIVQGAGGMRFYNAEYLRALRRECSHYDVVLIADEIATGFGRTGKMFACDHSGITPDIICLGKALTGGFMSFAATVACENVAQTISASAPHSFMHGPTFMGNPLAAAVAVESLNILTQTDVLSKVAEIEHILKEELEKARAIKGVADVRVLGAIGVLEMNDNVDMALMQRLFVEHGVWIRPFGRLVYIMPQYIISHSALRKLCRAMIKVVNISLEK